MWAGSKKNGAQVCLEGKENLNFDRTYPKGEIVFGKSHCDSTFKCPAKNDQKSNCILLSVFNSKLILCCKIKLCLWIKSCLLMKPSGVLYANEK